MCKWCDSFGWTENKPNAVESFANVNTNSKVRFQNFSTTMTLTSQTATLPTASAHEETSFKVVVSSTKEASKFVSCVDIEEKLDESSDEPEAELEQENPEPQTEVEPNPDSVEQNENDKKVAEMKDPNFFQYFFGCLPCVGNPK